MGHLGFSQRMLSKIVECNAAVENGVQREKQAADEMEAEFHRTLAQEQLSNDSLKEDLLSLRFKLEMAIKSHDGTVQKQEQLVQVQLEIAASRNDRAKKEKQIESAHDCRCSASLVRLLFSTC
jgi:hypothetical protein